MILLNDMSENNMAEGAVHLREVAWLDKHALDSQNSIFLLVHSLQNRTWTRSAYYPKSLHLRKFYFTLLLVFINLWSLVDGTIPEKLQEVQLGLHTCLPRYAFASKVVPANNCRQLNCSSIDSSYQGIRGFHWGSVGRHCCVTGSGARTFCSIRYVITVSVPRGKACQKRLRWCQMHAVEGTGAGECYGDIWRRIMYNSRYFKCFILFVGFNVADCCSWRHRLQHKSN